MTNEGSSKVVGLYPRLLGAAWDRLDMPVRQMHSNGAPILCNGNFRIRHGTNPLTRLMARIGRLPPERESTPIELLVTPTAEGETWQRSFGARRLVSLQSESGGLLADRFGIMEIRLRLEDKDGALRYQQSGVYFRLGSLSVPLPAWFAPRTTGIEKADGDDVRVAVEVRLPLLGRLVAYEGLLWGRTTAP